MSFQRLAFTCAVYGQKRYNGISSNQSHSLCYADAGGQVYQQDFALYATCELKETNITSTRSKKGRNSCVA